MDDLFLDDLGGLLMDDDDNDGNGHDDAHEPHGHALSAEMLEMITTEVYNQWLEKSRLDYASTNVLAYKPEGHKCNGQHCRIRNPVVIVYALPEDKGVHICSHYCIYRQDPAYADQHSDPIDNITNLYLCEDTGCIHICSAETCQEQRVLGLNKMMVCVISRREVGTVYVTTFEDNTEKDYVSSYRTPAKNSGAGGSSILGGVHSLPVIPPTGRLSKKKRALKHGEAPYYYYGDEELLEEERRQNELASRVYEVIEDDDDEGDNDDDNDDEEETKQKSPGRKRKSSRLGALSSSPNKRVKRGQSPAKRRKEKSAASVVFDEIRQSARGKIVHFRTFGNDQRTYNILGQMIVRDVLFSKKRKTNEAKKYESMTKDADKRANKYEKICRQLNRPTIVQEVCTERRVAMSKKELCPNYIITEVMKRRIEQYYAFVFQDFYDILCSLEVPKDMLNKDDVIYLREYKDYVYALMYKMKEGYDYEGSVFLPHDIFLSAFLPEPGKIKEYEGSPQTKKITVISNKIQKLVQTVLTNGFATWKDLKVTTLDFVSDVLNGNEPIALLFSQAKKEWCDQIGKSVDYY